jgi:hypothetical protein
VEEVLYTCTDTFYFSFSHSIWISRTLHFENYIKYLIVLFGKISFNVVGIHFKSIYMIEL